MKRRVCARARRSRTPRNELRLTRLVYSRGVGGSSGDAKKDILDLDDPGDGIELESGEIDPPDAPSTLIPAFDPQEYAAQFTKVDDDDEHDRIPTLTNEVELEEARKRSLPSRAPPRRPFSTKPGPLSDDDTDAAVEVDAEEEDLDGLDPEAQEAILRDRLAPTSRVPILARKLTDLGDVLDDPKTAFVLGFVDGILPLETIVEVTGLPELDTLRVLDRMVGLGVVVFRSRGS